MNAKNVLSLYFLMCYDALDRCSVTLFSNPFMLYSAAAGVRSVAFTFGFLSTNARSENVCFKSASHFL